MAAEVEPKKPKYNRKKCEHGRQACQCVDCGTGVCIHKKIKSMCVECGSSGICIHKKIKSSYFYRGLFVKKIYCLSKKLEIIFLFHFFVIIYINFCFFLNKIWYS